MRGSSRSGVKAQGLVRGAFLLSRSPSTVGSHSHRPSSPSSMMCALPSGVNEGSSTDSTCTPSISDAVAQPSESCDSSPQASVCSMAMAFAASET